MADSAVLVAVHGAALALLLALPPEVNAAAAAVVGDSPLRCCRNRHHFSVEAASAPRPREPRTVAAAWGPVQGSRRTGPSVLHCCD